MVCDIVRSSKQWIYYTKIEVYQRILWLHSMKLTQNLLLHCCLISDILIAATFRSHFVVCWLCYLIQSLDGYIVDVSLKIEARPVYRFGVVGVNVSGKPENVPFLSPWSTGFRS